MTTNDNDLEVIAERARETSTRLSNTVWAVSGTLIFAISAWTVNTLENLTHRVEELGMSIIKLDERVSRLPPADLLLRVKETEDDIKEMQDRLDTIARRVHAKLGIDTGAIITRGFERSGG